MADPALVKVIDFWQKNSEDQGLFPRSLVDVIDTKTKEIVDIVGPRRSGKSSVMKLLIQKLKPKGNCLYINFEDPYFLEHNKPTVIDEIIEAHAAYFKPSVSYIFFDEIQNVASWEKAIRKLRDRGYKIFLSGSSSKLLSSEFASLLTGRHISYQLLPLSFQEYLMFRNIPLPDKTQVLLQDTILQKYLEEFLNIGGFPAVVLSNNQELLKQYFTDIIQRDIVGRYEVRQPHTLEKMGAYLIGNSAKIVSLLSLQKLYEISYDLASTYFAYFKEAFLLFEMPQFSHSLKTQQKALKKIYPIDTGLANAVSFRFSQERGRMLEAIIFMELVRSKQEVYYYKTGRGKKVDFLIKGKSANQLIQVTWDMSEEKTKQREIASLLEAMKEQKLNHGLVLTFNSTERLNFGNKHISIRPVYQWLLKQIAILT